MKRKQFVDIIDTQVINFPSFMAQNFICIKEEKLFNKLDFK
jgi:hypothetical protein